MHYNVPGEENLRVLLSLQMKSADERGGMSPDNNEASLEIIVQGEEAEADSGDNSKISTAAMDNYTSLVASLRVREVLKELHFISKATGVYGNRWQDVEHRFDQLTASTDGLLPFSLFPKFIGMSGDSKEFAVKLCQALARRFNVTGDVINKEQLQQFWYQIDSKGSDSALQNFFDMVDRDADGLINEDDVRDIICLTASANKLSNICQQAQEYAALIMEGLDTNNDGYITIDTLKNLLLPPPTHLIRVGNREIFKQLVEQPYQTKRQKIGTLRRCYQKVKYALIDNWKRVWILTLWLGIMVGLFVYKFLQYQEKAIYRVTGYCICVAKGGAETLKFNMALVLLPVCRNLITWLRNYTKLGLIVPFDDYLNFHKVIATGIAVGTALHVGANLTCYFPRLLQASEGEYEFIKPFFGEVQPPNYWWLLKGVQGVTGIVMLLLMVVSFTLASSMFRRNRLYRFRWLRRFAGFNAFWYSHHLFIIVYALLIVHGTCLFLVKKWYQKTTWMYLAVPMICYTCERLVRAFRSSFCSVKILKATILSGNVLELHMTKPRGFKYKSGQYMFINCPTISPLEWHPFSFISGPGDNYLSVSIRTLGDWTSELRIVFGKFCRPSPADSRGLLQADFMEGTDTPSLPRILIDGPYGAPAQDYEKYEVVMLLGLGIGVTPLISIVRDIVNNTSGSRDGKASYNKMSKTFKTRKAYFYWITREQGSYEWFNEIMNEVVDKAVHTIELHNYCTSIFQEGDARSALISMIQSYHHAKSGMDVVSGTRVRTHFGRPVYRQIFKDIALQHPQSRVGVFYCGMPVLARELKRLSLEFSHKTSVKFDFHKEHF